MLNIVVGEFRKPKTLYDPKSYTDAEITEWGKKASFNGYQDAVKDANRIRLDNKKIGKEYDMHTYRETSLEGVTFETILRLDQSTGDWVVHSYYPIG